MVVSRVLVSVDRSDKMAAQVTDRLDAGQVDRLIGMLDEAARRLAAGEGEMLFRCAECCPQSLDRADQEVAVA